MRRLNINSNLDFNRILAQPSAIHNSILPSSIASLAAGYMPSYIFARLRTSGILHHSTAIVTNMIKSAVYSFQQSIWKDRCTRQAEKEQRLGITKAMKRTFTGRNQYSQTLQTNSVTTTAYHAVKEKWKLTMKRDLSMMTQVSRLFDLDFMEQIMVGLIIIIFLAIFLIFYKIVQGIGTLCFDHVTAFILCSLNV